MSDERERILHQLADAVVEMNEDKAAQVARDALDAGIEAREALLLGLSKGMAVVGQKYACGEYFIPHLLVSSDAMYAGIEVLKPHLTSDFTAARKRVVIGVVEGDTHDIGKNLVKLMLAASNFEVVDLGRDVPLEGFVSEAQKADAHLICMSTLMTTTMAGMQEVIERLQSEGFGHRFKTLVGGGPVSQGFAHKIGADGYARDALSAVVKAQELTQ